MGALRMPRAIRSVKSAGSSTLLRTKNDTTAGSRPSANMPRQPISGSSSGVSNAAASTPSCQPSPTYDDTRARCAAGQASATSVMPMPNSPPKPTPAIVRYASRSL